MGREGCADSDCDALLSTLLSPHLLLFPSQFLRLVVENESVGSEHEEAGRGVANKLLVNFPAMPNRDHQHQKFSVSDLAKDTVISNPVAPETGQLRLESFAEAARIVLPRDPFIEIRYNVPLCLLAQFAEFLKGAFVKSINPAHASLPPRSSFGPGVAAAFVQDTYAPNPQDIRESPHGHKTSWSARSFWPGVPNDLRSQAKDVSRS